jgi:hypothetical protein
LGNRVGVLADDMLRLLQRYQGAADTESRGVDQQQFSLWPFRSDCFVVVIAGRDPAIPTNAGVRRDRPVKPGDDAKDKGSPAQNKNCWPPSKPLAAIVPQ